ncbi:MAG: D-alanyl-D-alanine carboxypeptidase family protein [Cyanobacteria bacterium J06607_13]
MKPFDRIPKPYQDVLLPGVLSAAIVIGVGATVFTQFFKENPTRQPTNAEAASGLLVTPLGAGQSTPSSSETQPTENDIEQEQNSATAPPPPISSVVTPAPATTATEPKPPSPISQEAIADSSAPPAGNYENYDDLPGSLYNHFAFSENDPARNTSVGLFIRESYEREEYLDYEATEAFFQMQAAAAADGVSLMPISGFRTIIRQADLFKSQVDKLGSEAEAAKLSAPPGYSEHHTGYAIDIGDVNAPDTDIKYAFQNTDGYRWLVKNAGDYGFEQSFPQGNSQGVSFEPWHWRYVGSPRASEIFRGKRFR